MIVAGIGAGLVNTPLISTAVGVVEPARAGMASGINSTLRQVGVATGVAALGTILASHIRSSVVDGLSGTPLAGHAHAIAHAISTGGTAQAIASTPPPLRGLVAGTARSAFIDGLNTFLLIGAIVSFAAAVVSFALIRERDFVTTDAGEDAGRAGGGGMNGEPRTASSSSAAASAGCRRCAGCAARRSRSRSSTGRTTPLPAARLPGRDRRAAPAEIAAPLRAVLQRQRNARVLLAEVTGFDLERREVVLAACRTATAPATLGYDTLIVAGGSRYSYFGHDEWQAHAPELKSLEGALDIRSRILAAFEAAELETGPGARGAPGSPSSSSAPARPASRWPGRSPSSRATRCAATSARSTRAPRASCSSRPPTASSPRSRSRSRGRRRGRSSGSASTPLAGHTVVDVAADSVAIRDRGGEVERVAARTVVWAAGVTASASPRRSPREAGLEVDRAGRLTVEPGPDPARATRRCSRSATWSACRRGTIARCPGSRRSRCSRAATPRGRSATASAAATPRPFRYRDKGNLRRSAARRPSPTSRGSTSPASRPGAVARSSTSST